jgi:DNA-binding response OmpR family regulator
MAHTRRTVLHIDDDRLMLQLVADRLKREGYEVISIDDPSQAVSTLLDHDCRVVLLDIQMPGQNGLELLSSIKQYDGGVQVIMLTGLVSMNSVLESLRRGAEACVFKPLVDFGELLGALELTFDKLERWWRTLEDLGRRRAEERASADDR